MTPDMDNRLIEYIEGGLSPEECRQVELELAASEELRGELEQLRRILFSLDNYQLKQPGEKLRNRFYALLEQQGAENREIEVEQVPAPVGLRISQPAWAVAAAVALLVIGVGFGVLWQRNLRQQKQIEALVAEIGNTRRSMVLSMLSESSPSQRIKALNTVQREDSGTDPRIIRALFNVLNTDDNVNVRLKAAEALLDFSDHPGVVESLVSSLNNQESPEVQIALIEVLTAIKAKSAVGEFHRIIKSKEVHEVVRNMAAAGIQQLM